MSDKIPTGHFWFVNGYDIYQLSFSYYLRKPEHYYGEVPKWYRNDFMNQDDHGYTVGQDIWETAQEALEVAKKKLAKAIAQEIKNHKIKLDSLLSYQKKLEERSV